MNGSQATRSPQLQPPQVLFARQAIIDTAGRVRGYELLYRGRRGSHGEVPDAEHATCQVLAAAFAESGLGVAVGEVPAWINVSEHFLSAFDPPPLPPERTVIELLETHVPTAALVERLATLRDWGYLIALDDFVLTDASRMMLDACDIVKIEVQDRPREQVEAAIREVAERGLVALAEKVESQEQHDWAAAAGATLFQGYFFCRPVEVESQELRATSIARLRTAAGLADAEATLEAVDEVLRTDPDLSLRLLRYLNSAALSLPHRITSVRHAITMLGLNAVRQWALVLLVGGIGERRGPLLSTALIRARTCELLAHARGLPFPDAFFSVGLLSVGDALTGRPLTEIVAELPLADSVASALTGHSGPMGAALAAAIACEQGLLPERDPGLTLACYDDAIAWADGLELV